MFATIGRWWQIFSRKLLEYPSEDANIARRGYILSIITLATTFFALITAVLVLFGLFDVDTVDILYFTPFIFFGIYITTRMGYIQIVGIVTVLMVIAVTLNYGSFTLGPISLVTFAIAIILAGLLIGPRSMFVIAALASIISVFFDLASTSIGVTIPLGPPVIIGYFFVALTTYVLLQQWQSALGEAQRINVDLERARANLEHEVAERTRELQRSFDLTSQISAIVTSSQTLDDLFERSIELIQRNFNFYHVHIYTHEPNTNLLRMAYGSGMVGKTLQEQSHSIRFGQGIVGQAAQDKTPMVINNIDQFPGVVRNPLLPDTQSEMVLPLTASENILGVLDIQDNRANSFTESTQNLMTSLSNQLAVAVNNFRLVNEAQDALNQVEALNRRLIQENWERTLEVAPTLGYVYTPGQVNPVSDEWLPSMQNLMAQEKTAQNKDTPNASTDDVLIMNEGQMMSGSDLAIPIKLRGQTLGVLGLEREPGMSWREDDRLIVQAIAEQIGLALEGARLLEDTQRNAWRDQIVSETTAQVWSSTDIAEVLKVAVAQLGEKLDASEVIIRLGTEEELGL